MIVKHLHAETDRLILQIWVINKWWEEYWSHVQWLMLNVRIYKFKANHLVNEIKRMYVVVVFNEKQITCLFICMTEISPWSCQNYELFGLICTLSKKTAAELLVICLIEQLPALGDGTFCLIVELKLMVYFSEPTIVIPTFYSLNNIAHLWIAQKFLQENSAYSTPWWEIFTIWLVFLRYLLTHLLILTYLLLILNSLFFRND